MVRSRFVRSALLLLSLGAAIPAYARDAPAHPAVDPHHVDASTIGAPIDLTSNWLLHQGDDPRYADPAFDDSKWLVIHSDRPLATYGLKNVDEVWYRSHVHIPPNQRGLSVMMRGFGGSYTIFVNGVELGSSGPYPPGGSADAGVDRRFAIPSATIASGEVIVAIHGHIGRISERGTQPGGFMHWTEFELGPAPLLADLTSLHFFRNYASTTVNILFELLVPLLALALALTLPKEREYSALLIFSSFAVIMNISSFWRTVTNAPPTHLWYICNGLLQLVQVISLLEFVRIVLGLRRSRWWAGYEWLLAILCISAVPWVNSVLNMGDSVPVSSVIIISFFSIVSLPATVGIPLLALWVWWKRRNTDGLLLFVPFFLQSVVNYCNIGLSILNRFHLTDRTNLPPVPVKAIYLQWGEVTDVLFSVALLLFLVLRTVRIARSRAAMATDLHAVHSVQEILLARASHPTPGFRVEHVYHPALEVGGDFFLVSPGPDGSITAIVGDVSGKGLVAAMRVSMILGVLRREEHRDPATILTNLNEALLMQGEMGFTTACCVRLQADGGYTIANAGHINPYIDGEEIIAPSALPLGMVGNQQYEQISGLLPEGKTLVLMSDGVVEARSAKGELYGFDRLPQLTLMTAQDIADVARNFGQEDDITVLTVACGT